MRTGQRVSLLIVLVLTLTATVGCLGLAHQSQQMTVQEDAYAAGPRNGDPQTGDIANRPVDVEASQLAANEMASASTASPENIVDQILAEAEALYATGVLANRDGRWYDAQVAFEQATSLLADLDFESPDPADTINTGADDLAVASERLLNDIAQEYRQTLLAIGELDSDASLLAFLLRFEDLESIKQSALDSTKLIISNVQEHPGQVEYDFPIEMNDQVTSCVVYFQTVARDAFETYLRRAGRYLPMMKEIVASYGLPSDIAYLPLIESGFNNTAYSYAHAAGPWQFISSTGRKYGLNRNVWVDERRDFEKATHAAAQYLRDLYNMFDSWNLALASYNGGEGRVGRQIKRQKTRNFWKLRLHKQTRNYVPLFMAALLIAKDPEAFGFHVEPDPPIEFDWVATNKALELKDIARSLGCSKDALARLNPELRRDVTPPDVKPYRLRVPKGKGEVFAHVYHNLPESERTQWVQHKVRRGETLSGISRRYGVRVSEIVSHNKLRSRNMLRVGQRLEIPVPVAALSKYASKRSSSGRTKSPPKTTKGGKYHVKRGDTLWDLAKKFGTTTSAIRRVNNMGAHDKLYAGKTIRIPGASKKSGDSFWYTIRRGDTMSRIASKYGIALRRLVASNRSINPDRIRVGQQILVPSM